MKQNSKNNNNKNSTKKKKETNKIKVNLLNQTCLI